MAVSAAASARDGGAAAKARELSAEALTDEHAAGLEPATCFECDFMCLASAA